MARRTRVSCPPGRSSHARSSSIVRFSWLLVVLLPVIRFEPRRMHDPVTDAKLPCWHLARRARHGQGGMPVDLRYRRVASGHHDAPFSHGRLPGLLSPHGAVWGACSRPSTGRYGSAVWCCRLSPLRLTVWRPGADWRQNLRTFDRCLAITPHPRTPQRALPARTLCRTQAPPREASRQPWQG